ncbi:thiol:disulfide interchange protein [Sphingomonas naasensis]|uniref:Thiol:disulfide interchange protein n=1 Tax=Sphingomonas naasensis TaxID=1344951 RepID=A0A4S1W8N6_9SPHN|nr:protein-disulfide reductase DsbD domain-containing protein [Sphingomonas naasensis]NIJ19519.1 thiol:disulfide interchange protein [Sphingomonas naasensis]TGX39254.1 thiol:disulfide interchange protein [Sphingomonas naasensis]
MALLRFVLMSLALWLAIAPASAQAPGKGPHVRIELIAETERPAPGSEVTLAFASTPEPGWHAYWENPGDAGLPARASWTLPDGASAEPLRFPVPQRLIIGGLMNYVYEAPFAPLVTLKVPADATIGDVFPVRVKLDYLVCTNEICVPEKAELSTALTIGDGAVPADRRARFDGWRAALPKPLGTPAKYQIDGKTFRLEVPFPAAAALTGEGYFFPLTDGAIDYAAPQRVVRDGDRIVVEAPAKRALPKVDGLLAFGGQGFTLSAAPGTVAPTSASAGAPSSGWIAAALFAFLGAVAGGVILNIMPCVFPILSLKALSLVKAGDQAGNPRGEALAYTAGVVLTCLALGGLLLGLRAGGAAIGWAFQLQDPRVILFLLLLVTGIALNLAGLFELSAPGFANRAAARGNGGAFLTGALAAFVATPCAGPFMATALGAALILPSPAALAVFGGLGLGIALPFLLLGFVPALRRRLPKPGAWMATLRRILSIPMFLTALALAWVLGRQAGVDGMTIGLGAALLAAFGLWWAGRRQARGLSRAWLPALPLLLLALAGMAMIHPAPPEAARAAPAGSEAFSEARLAALRAEGRPVFAYFTADWCLTCKVNEKGAIETEAVRSAFEKGKVAVLVGDWTNGDPALGRFIERHNRAGVPLYLWYRPGSAEPEVLPQVLTQAMLQNLAGVNP